MNHRYKIGLLATCDGHYIHVGNTTSELSNIVRTGALCFLIPIQMAGVIDMVVGDGDGGENPTIKDRSKLKAGTSENSKQSYANYSGDLSWSIVTDQISSKLQEPEFISRDGGKIIEEAKAESNVSDTVRKIFPRTLQTFKPNGPNSILLSMTYSFNGLSGGGCYARGRYYSTCRKDISQMKWDANWTNMEEKVRKDQIKLVELATKVGNTKDGAVLKLQRQMALSLEFRRLAVQKVLTNKGGKTSGVDKLLITTDEQK